MQKGEFKIIFSAQKMCHSEFISESSSSTLDPETSSGWRFCLRDYISIFMFSTQNLQTDQCRKKGFCNKFRCKKLLPKGVAKNETQPWLEERSDELQGCGAFWREPFGYKSLQIKSTTKAFFLVQISILQDFLHAVVLYLYDHKYFLHPKLVPFQFFEATYMVVCEYLKARL